MSHPAYAFDDSLWPLLVLEATGAMSVAQFEEGLARWLRLLERGGQCVTLLEVQQVDILSAEQRRLLSEWLEQHAALLQERLLGLGFVSASPAVRLTMSVLMHHRSMPTPYMVASSRAAVIGWAIERFEHADLHAHALRLRSLFGLPPARAGAQAR